METPDLAAGESAGGNTTAHRSSSSETLPSSLVLPLNPRAEGGPFYPRLYGPGIQWGLSIESAELSFPHIRDRSVYGTIHVNSEYCRVHTVYDRRSSDPEKLSSSPSDLTLSGPRYFLTAYAPTAMYVTLYELGITEPLLHQMVPLDLSNIVPTKTKSVLVEPTGGGWPKLTVVMTAITPATLTDINLELYYPQPYNEWLVSGSVTAVQTIRLGKKTRRVSLFRRPPDDPVRAAEEDAPTRGPVSPGRRRARISPDRKVFLAPLLFVKSLIEKKNKAYRDAGLPGSGLDPDNDFYNGVGCFLSVEVELRFVSSVDEVKCCVVRGSLHYQFDCTHDDGAIFRASLKGRVLPRLGADEEEIEVVVSLEPWIDVSSGLDGEPNECDLPLYCKPAIEPTYSDTDSDPDGCIFFTEDEFDDEDEFACDEMGVKDEEP